MLLYSFLALACLVAGVTLPAGRADQFEFVGLKLEVSATPEKSEFMLGEPGYVLFKVANLSEKNLLIQVGGDYRNALGRPDSFKVDVVGSDGQKVFQPDSKYHMGGKGYAKELPVEGDCTFHLFLPHWATFSKPDSYVMTIRRKLELFENWGSNDFPRTTMDVEVSAVAKVTIVPTNSAKMGKIIDDLGEKILNRSSDQMEKAEQMLAAIRDERVVPYYIALAETPHFRPRIEAAYNLGKYKNNEAFEALKKLLKTTGADIRDSATTLELAESSAESVRGWTIRAIADSPHPQAIATLWTYANDRNDGIRLTILHKAAGMRTAEAMNIIQKMLADKDERIRNEAMRYKELIAKEVRDKT